MKQPIFLDYAASTPVDPSVVQTMSEHMSMGGVFGNPASRSHVYGWQAEEAVEAARSDLARLLNADPREIVWTSGATEADNLAIKGVVQRSLQQGKRHIVTSAIEHKAVLDTCEFLGTQGFEITYVLPDAHGRVTAASIENALREDTALVSVMQVNNELGTLSDIADIASLCRRYGVLSHTDGAQSFGKIPVDVKALGVDMFALSGHKIYGPKGVGALYVRRAEGLKLTSQLHGGGHEMGMRSGTLPTHQIVGLVAAAALMHEDMIAENQRIEALRRRFERSVLQHPGTFVNGHLDARIPQILNVAFAGLSGETLLLSLKDIAISSGSACNSTSVKPSHVLTGIGLEEATADASLRFSFGRYTTTDDIDLAAAHLADVIARLRA